MRLFTKQSLAIAGLLGLAQGFGADQTCLDIKGNVSSSSAVITSPRESCHEKRNKALGDRFERVTNLKL